MICARPCVLLQYISMVLKPARERSHTSPSKRNQLSSSLYNPTENRAVGSSRCNVCEAKSRREVNEGCVARCADGKGGSIEGGDGDRRYHDED